MKRKKKNVSENNLKTAFIFLTLVFFLIFISGIFKIVTLIGQSKYDGVHRFTIVISYINNAKHLTEIISFAPDTHTLSALRIPISLKSKKETSKLAAIPIDGFILVSNQNGQKYAKQEVDSEIQSILLSYRDIKTDLTIIDVFRIWLFSKTLSSNSVSVKDIADFPNAVIEDKILSTLFNDYTFSQEKNSIEIINAADISGLGNRVARALTNMGGNVISVSTSDKTSQTSQILYFGDKTYTVEKLGKVLGLATFQTEKQGISDVTIILGKDSANYLPF
ncbi:MAG: hypothetical protein A3H79_00025 [Candidatus Levybacteria bacterium RIFCSPLOWO2_02_FULL_36_8b]|nr:MAG: hypothetical protein A3H79_00025 [Candidatus Levybacteria bacterium RIFCSPLOWO2_02_FULL_36_8b]